MKLSEFLVPEAMVPNLAARDKHGVLAELVNALVKAGAIEASVADSVVEGLMRREALGSTGIGHGVAIPHTKHKGVTRSHLAIGRSKAGIPFDALDGAPVHLFFVLVSPERSSQEHLEALEYITELVKDAHSRKRIQKATTRERLLKALVDAEERKTAETPP